MGISYRLVSLSRPEWIDFARSGVAPHRELITSAVAARIITAYRLLRPYDYLTYMWDGQLQVPPFGIWRRVDLTGYRNVTEALITSLIGQGLLAAGDWYWVTETPNDTPDRYFRQLLGSGRIWPDDSAPQE